MDADYAMMLYRQIETMRLCLVHLRIDGNETEFKFDCTDGCEHDQKCTEKFWSLYEDNQTYDWLDKWLGWLKI